MKKMTLKRKWRLINNTGFGNITENLRKERDHKKIKILITLKPQQRCRSEKHNVFTDKVNKIALNAQDDKKIQSIDSIETYPYGTRKDLVCRKEEINCNNIIKQYKNV